MPKQYVTREIAHNNPNAPITDTQVFPYSENYGLKRASASIITYREPGESVT